MKNLLKRMKLNNKGDTLAIVLIGMLILGVLGTAILGTSSINVEMKISNLKSKQNFYYVERAVDDIYAGIGKSVSVAMQKAYDDTVKSVVVSDGGSGYKENSNATLQTNFSDKYLGELNNSLQYKGNISDVLAELKGFINANIDFYDNLGVKIDVRATDVMDPSDKNYTKVELDTSKITIKNVVISSKSNVKNYESSITTDFVIETPKINFSFNDTETFESNLEEFFKYAIIADGQVNTTRLDAGGNSEKGAVYLEDGKATINGNIYAGEYHNNVIATDSTTPWIDKDGFYLNRDTELVINGANVISKGAVRLENRANITMNGESSSTNPRLDSYLPLRLWSNDIDLSGHAARADINGDCFIKDDLEVNGDRCYVDISGSYYGFGFDADSTTGSEKNSGDMEIFNADGEGSQEHERRSAVIVNGREADVKLTTDGDKEFVLGGRAYIDLSNSSGTGTQTKAADYMTGESISIKGNQKIYLLDNPASYQNKDPNITPSAIIKGNPASERDLGFTPGSYTSDEFYNNLNLDDKQVVAKKVGDSIYFYNRQKNPQRQTDYVVDAVKNTTKNYWEILNDAVANMNIINLCLGNNTKSYTVGTAMQVVESSPGSGKGVLTTDRGGTLPHLANGIDEEYFKDIIEDVSKRYSGIMYDLSDDRDSNHPIGSTDTVYSIGDSSISPYNYFINTNIYNVIPDDLNANRNIAKDLTPSNFPGGATPNKNYPERTKNGKDYALNSISTDELKDAGIPENATILLSVCDNNNSIGTFPIKNNLSSGDTVYGVIVCSGDVTLDCNFEGMIICGGDVVLNGGDYTFTANPKLMNMLYKKSEFLQELIGESKPPIITPPEDVIIDPDGELAFDKFVKIDRWRKNAD